MECMNSFMIFNPPHYVEVSGQFHDPHALPRGPATHWMGVWAGPGDDMGAVEKLKMFFSCRKSNPSSTVVAARRVIVLCDIYCSHIKPVITDWIKHTGFVLSRFRVHVGQWGILTSVSLPFSSLPSDRLGHGSFSILLSVIKESVN